MVLRAQLKGSMSWSFLSLPWAVDKRWRVFVLWNFMAIIGLSPHSATDVPCAGVALRTELGGRWSTQIVPQARVWCCRRYKYRRVLKYQLFMKTWWPFLRRSRIRYIITFSLTERWCESAGLWSVYHLWDHLSLLRLWICNNTHHFHEYCYLIHSIKKSFYQILPLSMVCIVGKEVSLSTRAGFHSHRHLVIEHKIPETFHENDPI